MSNTALARFVPRSLLNWGRGMSIVVAFMALVRDATAAEPSRIDLYGDALRAGAAVRLGTVRYRTLEYYNLGLAFSPDDETVFVANPQGLEFISAATGKLVRQASSRGQHVDSLHRSADGLMALTFGHEFNAAFNKNVRSVQRFDLLTGNVLAKGLPSERIGTQVALFPDGHTIATCAGNGLFGIWDLSSGKELASYDVFRGGGGTVAVCPDGQLVAIGTTEGLYLWERGSDKEPEKVAGLDRVQSLAFSHDGSILAESSGLGTEIVLRDVRSKRILRRLSNDERRPMYIGPLVFTSDGKSLVAGNTSGIRGVAKCILIWDVGTGKLVRRFETGQIRPYHLAVSGDDRWLAAVSTNALVKVWDLATDMSMDEEFTGHEAPITAVAFTPDGGNVMSASDDGTVRVWDAATGRQQRVLRHKNWVRAAALSPDGRFIAASSFDDTVRLWETASGREVYRLPGHGETGSLRAVAFSADGARFSSWGDDTYLRTWEAKTGKGVVERIVRPAAEIEPAPVETQEDQRDSAEMEYVMMSASPAVFSRDARRLLLGTTLFDAQSGEVVGTVPPRDGYLASLTFTYDAARVATSGQGKPIEALSENGEARLSEAKNQMVRVRDVESGEELLALSFPDSSPGPVTFSVDGKLVAVASRGANATLRVLDVATVAERTLTKELPSDPRVLAFSRDARRLACGFGDGGVLIWDLKFGEKSP